MENDTMTFWEMYKRQALADWVVTKVVTGAMLKAGIISRQEHDEMISEIENHIKGTFGEESL